MCKKCETIPGSCPNSAPEHKKARAHKLPTVVDRVFGVPLVHRVYQHIVQGSYITKKGRHFEQHALLYKGDLSSITPDTVVTMRINSACYTGDIFHDELCDCNWQLEAAIDIVDKNDGIGIVLYHFAHEGKGFGYFNKLKSFDGKMYPVPGDIRDFLHAVAILQDLGVKKVRCMTNNPEKQQMLRDHGIEIVEVVPVVSADPRHGEFYDYKAKVWGHALPTLEDRAREAAGTDGQSQQ